MSDKFEELKRAAEELIRTPRTPRHTLEMWIKRGAIPSAYEHDALALLINLDDKIKVIGKAIAAINLERFDGQRG